MKATLRALATASAMGLLALAGCAENVGDLNRVQPNFVKKDDFSGIWYVRQTIVDVPPAVNFSFIGMTLDMEKVRWEITEGYLVGYRAYELYPGKNPEVDHENKEPGSTPTDQEGEYWNEEGHHDAPLYAFRIQSHFDIQRQYNPATGEQTNVIGENASDRPWYERKFMRVDWGMNMVENINGDVTPTPFDTGRGKISFTEYVQEAEGGTYAFRMEDADGNPVVIDPTDPAFSERRLPDYFDVTRRLYVGTPTIEYGGQQYPSCWFLGRTSDCAGGEVKIRFSALKVPEAKTYEARVYDDRRMLKFGLFRTERNTWDDRRGHTDEGQIYLANIHNLWETAYEANGTRMLPEKRKPKPIVYALSAGFPAELVGAAEETARGWSKAFTRAVAAAQGKTFDEVFKLFPYENPATGAYRNEGLFRLDYNTDGNARIGDLRYNFMYWVDSPQQVSPLGYGPSSSDPETGEIIASQAYVYGSSIDTYAQYALDLVKLLNGDLSFDDVSSGGYVRDYIEQNRDRTDPRNRAELLANPEALDRPVAELFEADFTPQRLAKLEAMRQFGPGEVGQSFSQRLNRIKDTPFESYLVNDEIRGAVAARTRNIDLATGDLTSELLEAAMPFTLDASKQLRDDQLRRDWAMKNSIWLTEFADASVEGLAKHVKELGLDDEAAYQYVRNAIFRGVMEHEVGHTVGLRHNFQGSYDSINFFDEYWELRKTNLISSPQSVDDFMGMAAQSQAQIDGRMREYQYSSIMDYGSRFNSDVHGLGKYDEAAIVFGYADHVEVFEDVGAQFKSRYWERYSSGTPRYENRGSLAYDHLLDVTHYTRIPFMMGDNDPERGIRRLKYRSIMPYETLRALQEENEPSRPVEVPYMFCSDEWRGAIASCQLWDEGADSWEQTMNVVEGWRNYYVFNNFRRDRWGWDPYSTYSRSFSRYFTYLPNIYQHWLLGLFYSDADDTTVYYGWFGVKEGLNLLTEVLATPEYGDHCWDQTGNRYLDPYDFYYEYGANCQEVAQIPQGVGRRAYSRYAYDRGYYYYYYPLESGHFWDFYAASLALAQSQATVRGVETQSDFSTYSIPYYLYFEEELKRVYNGLVTGDMKAYAPRMVTGAGGAANVVYRPASDYLGIETPEFVDNTPVVEPPTNFTNKFYTLLFGMAGFVVNGDLSFADTHRVFRLGTGETLDPGAGFELQRYEDDRSGVVYAALLRTGETPNGATRFIQDANAFKVRRDDLAQQADVEYAAGRQSAGDDLMGESRRMQSKIDNIIQFMNMERGLYDVFGTF